MRRSTTSPPEPCRSSATQRPGLQRPPPPGRLRAPWRVANLSTCFVHPGVAIAVMKGRLLCLSVGTQCGPRPRRRARREGRRARTPLGARTPGMCRCWPDRMRDGFIRQRRTPGSSRHRSPAGRQERRPGSCGVAQASAGWSAAASRDDARDCRPAAIAPTRASAARYGSPQAPPTPSRTQWR